MVAGLSRRVSILSNLDKETAEEFQVCRNVYSIRSAYIEEISYAIHWSIVVTIREMLHGHKMADSHVFMKMQLFSQTETQIYVFQILL